MTLLAGPHFYLLLALLALMAFMYASVGHGGASGYLAVLALFGAAQEIMKPSALILNIFVSLISFIQFYRGGHFRWGLFWPFALTSVPAAYMGALTMLEEGIYRKILGVCLLMAVLRLVLMQKEPDNVKPLPVWKGLLTGSFIGFLSGMIGIGGGIILSPVILLMHWGRMKETAAVSALFILVNSISGLGALIIKGYDPSPEIFLWVVTAAISGFAGAFYGSNRFNNLLLHRMLALVLLVATVKLFTVS